MTGKDGSVYESDRSLASGIFKFPAKISYQSATDFAAHTWANDPNFVELSLRGCDGEGKFGIAFTYRYSGDREEFESFLEACVGKLMIKFRCEIGWDVSSWTRPIKPAPQRPYYENHPQAGGEAM